MEQALPSDTISTAAQLKGHPPWVHFTSLKLVTCPSLSLLPQDASLSGGQGSLQYQKDRFLQIILQENYWY